MIWIYPEQLAEELKLNKKYKFIYILYGNDLCVLQDTHEDILNTINNTLHSHNNLNIEIDINYDWVKIFNLFKTTNLFFNQRILSLKFSQDYPVTILNKNMSLLTSLVNKNLLLILFFHTSDLLIKHRTWMQFFNKIAIFINCITPENKRLETWIINQSNRMKLTIEKLACQLLCYYYEGNTVLLKQTLQYLSLIFPDGNLNFVRIKNIITDAAFFNFNHWIEAILTGNKHRANRILKRLECSGSNFRILLYKIQYEILIIIQIKLNLIKKESLYILFKKYKVYTKYHRMILLQSVNRLNQYQINQAISLLVQMELRYHKNYIYPSRANFELLTELLCNNDGKFFSINII